MPNSANYPDYEKPDGNLRDEELDILFKKMLREGREIIFEDGMDNPIRHKTLLYVVLFREKFLEFILRCINNYDYVEVMSNMLHYLGQIDNIILWDERRDLLEYYLIYSRSSRIKDGASLGLAHMDDPKSLPCFRIAVTREKVDTLRSWLIQVIEQLVVTKKQKESEEKWKKEMNQLKNEIIQKLKNEIIQKLNPETPILPHSF